jgi:hypothetical protein
MDECLDGDKRRSDFCELNVIGGGSMNGYRGRRNIEEAPLLVVGEFSYDRLTPCAGQTEFYSIRHKPRID